MEAWLGSDQFVWDIFEPQRTLERLRISSGLPQSVSSDEISEARIHVEELEAEQPKRHIDHSNLRQLALPWHRFNIHDILFILQPPPPTLSPVPPSPRQLALTWHRFNIHDILFILQPPPPTLSPVPPSPRLEHLEITLEVADCDPFTLDELATSFDALAPSISFLVLRIRSCALTVLSEGEADSLERVVHRGLLKCTELQHLEFGTDVCRFRPHRSLRDLPLRTVTFLHFAIDLPIRPYILFVQLDCPPTLALAIPPIYRLLSELCESSEVGFKVDIRAEEAVWWQNSF
ncbi:hypothetical protein JCM11641_000073 [Rhodosporidiobolus odoratus]